MRRALLTSTLIALFACPAAHAQKGVTVDPDSPAAKEYALPVEAARQAATGRKRPAGRSQPQAAAEPAPLFGEGVGDPAPATSGDKAARRGKRGSGASSAPRTTTPGIEQVVRSATGRPGAPDGGGFGTNLLIIGGGAVIVGAGAAAGLARRRRRAG